MPHTRVVAALIAFNEVGKIGSALDRFRPGHVTEAIVVDDGSTDATSHEVESRGVTLLRQERRQGVGAAIRRAIRYAIDGGFDVLVIMAGNDKDRPEEISRVVEPIASGRADLVQGSRYLPGGAYGQMPFYRLLATRYVHPWLFSLLVRRRFTDSTNGFRAIRVALFNDPRLDLNQDWLDQYRARALSLVPGHRARTPRDGGARHEGLSAGASRVHEDDTTHRLVEHSQADCAPRTRHQAVTFPSFPS